MRKKKTDPMVDVESLKYVSKKYIEMCSKHECEDCPLRPPTDFCWRYWFQPKRIEKMLNILGLQKSYNILPYFSSLFHIKG